ncbi:MAG: UpxY family transcription antiterminator [Bacteroides sp.]|nr:UpxY family transcription antiterminator [Bacteroides sp.]
MTSQHHNIIEHLNKSRLWYIVLTGPHSELKTKAELEKDGFVAYLPLTPVQRRWAGHIKEIHTPTVSKYVFIYASEEEVQNVQKHYPILPLSTLSLQ